MIHRWLSGRYDHVAIRFAPFAFPVEAKNLVFKTHALGSRREFLSSFWDRHARRRRRFAIVKQRGEAWYGEAKDGDGRRAPSDS